MRPLIIIIIMMAMLAGDRRCSLAHLYSSRVFRAASYVAAEAPSAR